jgi:PAS domain S-box-containing protein
LPTELVEVQGKDFEVNDSLESERRREQEALRESEEKYRQLVKHAPSGIYEIDYKKNKIINVNDLMCEYSGYTREELLSMNPFDFLTEDSKRLYTERIEKMISGIQVPEKVEFKIRRKDGKELWVLLNIRFVYEDANIRRATVVAHDIDDRKKAEEILCKTHDELEDKVRERTAELEKSKSKLIKEIKDHKITEKKLRKREKELENKTNDLEELNAALRVLLNKREEDKMTLQDNILSNVKTIIEPYVAKLKQYNLQQGQVTLINILESNLNEIVSPFTRQLSSQFFNLSPSEIQVANLVKYGKTNKEIAEMQHVTQRTIAFHRENIRKKLGIKNQKTNLKTYLMSLE